MEPGTMGWMVPGPVSLRNVTGSPGLPLQLSGKPDHAMAPAVYCSAVAVTVEGASHTRPWVVQPGTPPTRQYSLVCMLKSHAVSPGATVTPGLPAFSRINFSGKLVPSPPAFGYTKVFLSSAAR